MKHVGVLCSFMGTALVLNGSASFAGVMDSLSPEDQAAINQGHQVAKFENVRSSTFPKCKIYQRIHSTPEEAAAVFNHAENYPSYLSSVFKEVKLVSSVQNKSVLHYKAALPFGLPVIEYDAHNLVTSYDQGGNFHFSWTVDPTLFVHEANGSARFEALGTETVFEYVNYLNPNIPIKIDWAINGMKKQVKEMVAAIPKQIEHEKSADQKLLQSEVQALRAVVLPE